MNYIAIAILMTSCGFRPAIKSAYDVAVQACEAIAGRPGAPLAGLSPSQWCAIARNVQPFVDGLLSAQRRTGLSEPIKDAR